MKETKLFPCYSLPLRDYLSKNNIRYELVGKHPETDNMFWVYIKNEKLNELLRIWKETNK